MADIDLTIPGGDSDMAEVMSAGCDVIVHGMNQAYGNANSRAMEAANHYGLNVEYQYLMGIQNFSLQQSMAYRTAAESGAGRTRVEANTPAGGQTVGG